MRKVERRFYPAVVVSLAVHFLVLCVLITKPPAEKPAEFKELRVKLGIKNVNASSAGRDISENLYFKQPFVANIPQAENDYANQARKVVSADAEITEETQQPQEVAQEPANEVTPLPENEEVKTINFAEKKVESNSANTKKNEKGLVKILEPASKKLVEPAPASMPAPQPLARAMAAQGEGVYLGNSHDDDAEELTSYEQMLPLWLDKFRVYPEAAKQQGIEGRGDIFIKIDRNGRVLLSKVIKSTGHAELDRALMKMVEDADPVIPVPPEYYEDKKTFSYKITFEFRN